MRPTIIIFVLVISLTFAARSPPSDLVDTAVHPFKIDVPEPVLEDLKLRIDR